jgi:hypothetical protein
VAECCSSSRESGDLIEMVLRRVSTDQCVGQGVYIDLDRRIGRERRRRKRRVWRGWTAYVRAKCSGLLESWRRDVASPGAVDWIGASWHTFGRPEIAA